MIQVHDLRFATPEQVGSWADHISRNLRDQDLAEIEAMGAVAPDEALRVSIQVSTHGYCIMDRQGNPCAMFGAAPHPLPGVGVVWMLGTDAVRSEAYSIARKTRHYFDTLNEPYNILWNFIDARNSVSKRWLQWGGFSLIKDVPIGGHPFHIFARTNNV